MRRLIVMILLLADTWIGIQAQQYSVFYLKGQVQCKQKGKTTVLEEKQQVSADAKFTLEKGTALILKDEANHRLPIIKGPCKGNLQTLVKKDKASIKECSEEYFKYLAGKSRNEVKNKADLMRAQGSVDRKPIPGRKQPVIDDNDEIDALLLDVSNEIESIIEELEKE